jgi:hypothetical protein
MKKHKYSETVDGIVFSGQYTVEEVDDSYPIFSLCTLMVGGMDLMLVIDPRVVHEIQFSLVEDWRWNS